MIPLAEALHASFAEREWEPEVRQSIDDCLDAAYEWREGRLPLEEAKRLGELADRTGITSSAARSQCRAMMACSLEDARRPALMAMLTAVIERRAGVIVTTKGWIVSRDELLFHGVHLNDPGGA